MSCQLVRYDSDLKVYAGKLDERIRNYEKMYTEITAEAGSLEAFADTYRYFGLHRTEDGGMVFREWAPGADEVFLYGDFNNWNPLSHPLKRLPDGVFEIRLTAAEAMKERQKYKLLVSNGGKLSEHIPSHANFVVQDPGTWIWTAEAHFKDEDFEWHDADFRPEDPLLIYECHIGMSGEKEGISTYAEFTRDVLPRVKKDGYNTIQLMAVMEHPYYASFGYQVTNFFASSSRFGFPEELKELINTAHQMGIRVLLDVVHSHAAPNSREGLNRFDGTEHQYFHEGARGSHEAWGTKLFDYGKKEVLRFLLSNLKYWISEFHFDGFRFDGVTSMLYLNHGLGETFGDYEKYFSGNVDEEAVTYLTLANALVHGLKKDAVTIAEDMSGMPGMAAAIEDGGIGFDYRLSMGVPDMWIRLLKDCRDEDWELWRIWYELTNRRPHEKAIGYAESHDQALVGDQTLMFRLCDREMYYNMSKMSRHNMVIDRGMALHKMIRLISCSLAGEGYLNFMGNEFGHPEWVDFPREGNGWSYRYCRRQWSLVDDPNLKYSCLAAFDRDMIALVKEKEFYGAAMHSLYVHEADKVLIYERNGLVFVFNFSPDRSFTGYFVPVLDDGDYEAILTTDEFQYGGFGRIDKKVNFTAVTLADERTGFLAYLPSRTAAVYRRK